MAQVANILLSREELQELIRLVEGDQSRYYRRDQDGLRALTLAGLLAELKRALKSCTSPL